MLIVYGTRCYGRADAIDGLGYVTCRFVHIMFVPLVPIQTVFLFSDDRGINLPFSFKAAMSGWLRGGAIVTGLGMLAAAIGNFGDGEPLLGAVCVVLAVLAFGAFPLLGMLFGKCSPMRRAEIMAAMGIDANDHGGYVQPPQPPPQAWPQQQPQYPQQQYPQHPQHPQYPQYPQQPQGYGGPPPPAGGFGHAPAYGAPPAFGPTQGAPPQPYGAPPPAYGAPQPPQPYGAPPPGYGPPGYDPRRR